MHQLQTPPAPHRTCALCQRRRTIQANWPLGPVCSTCYSKTTRNPAPCSRCHTTRVLVGRADDSQLICGPCAGVNIDFACITCAHPGDIHAEGQCTRCVVRDRVTDLLRRPGQPVTPQLLPLAEALIRARNPTSVLQWLRTSPVVRLIADLVDAHTEVSHELLDELPQDPNIDYLRATLVATDILPPRQEQLDRLTPWLTSTLAGLPAHHLRYLRPFAEWEILRTARRSAARSRYTANSATLDRAEIRTAIEFLAWVDQQHADLPAITQGHIDQWVTTGRPIRRCLHAFLRWTAARKITTTLTITPKRSGLPTRFLDEQDHLDQLQRCLGETSLPLEVRIAGALIRLYATPLTRIVELTADHLHRDNNDAFLTLGNTPVIVPPSLATLIDQQLTQLQRGTIPDRTHYLFPGKIPNRPLLSGSLGERLLRHNLATTAAHNTAMALLVTDLPAVVVSDLIGINVSTANQWLGYARTNWADYLAARQGE